MLWAGCAPLRGEDVGGKGGELFAVASAVAAWQQAPKRCCPGAGLVCPCPGGMTST